MASIFPPVIQPKWHTDVQHYAEPMNVIFQESKPNVTSHPLAIIMEAASGHLPASVNADVSQDMIHRIIAKAKLEKKYKT